MTMERVTFGLQQRISGHMYIESDSDKISSIHYWSKGNYSLFQPRDNWALRAEVFRKRNIWLCDAWNHSGQMRHNGVIQFTIWYRLIHQIEQLTRFWCHEKVPKLSWFDKDFMVHPVLLLGGTPCKYISYTPHSVPKGAFTQKKDRNFHRDWNTEIFCACSDRRKYLANRRAG